MIASTSLAASIEALTESQRGWVLAVIEQFQLTTKFEANPASNLVNYQVLERLGDALRIHHAFSRQALSKDRFEFAFERALSLSGFQAVLAPSRTNPGHDLTIDGVRVSLKTEASASIKVNSLHISKFMELGQGEWVLSMLRDQFFEHMEGYDRVLQFRSLEPGPVHYCYELVEIPKVLLQESANFSFDVMHTSTQNPKPGYCKVKDAQDQLKFSLYFDGGSERKLQIKHIRKDLCIVHATWIFDSAPLA